MIFLLFLPLASCAKGAPCGRLTVRVLDGFTERPIEGARVTVPEAGVSLLTDACGETESMRVPVISDGEYDRLLPSPSGRATLIVTAPGYTPYLLLYARIAPESGRRIDALLFPADGSMDVFPVIEAPDEGWCGELVRKFAK